jgi:hypothetical protein
MALGKLSEKNIMRTATTSVKRSMKIARTAVLDRKPWLYLSFSVPSVVAGTSNHRADIR